MRQQHGRDSGIIEQKIPLRFAEFRPEYFAQVCERNGPATGLGLARIHVFRDLQGHLFSGPHRLSREIAVDHAPNSARIRVLQFRR